MNRLDHKRELTQRRKERVRASVTGTSERPRLTVQISNTSVNAQIIDDTKGATLVSQSSPKKGSITEKAATVGTEIAKAAKSKRITKVVLDKNGRQYQQRLNALAEAARKEGLEF